MVIILDGIKPDPGSSLVSLHRGTRDYLRRIGARAIARSERDVPAHLVDNEGKYVGEDVSERDPR